MSRIPQPSSSRRPSKTNTSSAPTTQTRPRVLNSITSTPSARTYVQSTKTARDGSSISTSPSTLKPNTSAVRRTGSTVSLKVKAPATPRPQSGSPAKAKPSTSTNVNSHVVPEKTPTTSSMSVREAIALKRAEVKKAQAKSSGRGGFDAMSSLQDALPPHANPAQQEEDLLGRATLRETIDKARSTGSLNLATRSLKCLPSALYEVHLNVTPEPLESVPDEAPLPLVPDESGTSKGIPAWFEAQDLLVIKAWGNEIQEIQPEISLFGSLKVIDLHYNQLKSIPDTLADLSVLTNLDLSHNCLSALPNVLFALPELTNLNLSHNALTSLPFNAYFVQSGSHPQNNHNANAAFFGPQIIRSSSPLPKLLILNVSHNQITSDAIDVTLPEIVSQVDLSENPLGPSQTLLKALSSLSRLKELLMAKTNVGDDSFPVDIFPSSSFPSLKVLDLSETRVTLDVIRNALRATKQNLDHDLTCEGPPEGVMRVVVGKKIIKEAWEIELEKRVQRRIDKSFDLGSDWDESSQPTSTSPSSSTLSNVHSVRSISSRPTRNIQQMAKDSWEVEAEADCSRSKEATVTATARVEDHTPNANRIGLGWPASVSRTTNTPTPTLMSPQYYEQSTQTLTLPPSQPIQISHNRASSLTTRIVPSSSPLADMAIPLPSLPLNIIVTESFAHSLRSLILVNRRADRSFVLPSSAATDPQGFLPCLEELDLEGCNFSESIPVLHADVPSSSAPSTSELSNARSNQPLLSLIATLFPSLRTLNLSYNALSSSTLTQESLSALILSLPEGDGATRKEGLRHLRLRGNRITDLDGFATIAGMFKGNRIVSEWKLEELDLRDNEIGRLPPEIGLLPLDVLLVDGNTFRVPQHRVWEREGTKGLLGWLRGRIE